MASSLPDTYSTETLFDPSALPISFGSVGSSGVSISAIADLPLAAGAPDNSITVQLFGGAGGAPDQMGGPTTPINPNAVRFELVPAAGEAGVPLPVLGSPQPVEGQPGAFRFTPGLPDNFADGSQVVARYMDSQSNSLTTYGSLYPNMPPYEVNESARQMAGQYGQAAKAFTSPLNRGASATLEQELAMRGIVPLEQKDDTRRKESLRGAPQEAVSRFGGLSDVLRDSHLADEMLKLELWLLAFPVMDLSVSQHVSDYVNTIRTSVSRLGYILSQYDFNNKGSEVVQSSNALNSSAHSHRFNCGTVFDVYSPATLFNTEYLIQQSSVATIRQTSVDQLSCFYRWHRAEKVMVNQTMDMFNYATNQMVNGGNVLSETYNRARHKVLEGINVQVGGFAAPKPSALGGGGGGNSSESSASTSGGGGGGGGGGRHVGLPGANVGANSEETPTDGDTDSAADAETPVEPIKANYELSATGNINFFSLMGRFLAKAKESFLATAADVVLFALKDVFIKANEKLALESNSDLNITCTDGRLALDADQIIFRSTKPIQVYIGKGPAFMQESLSGEWPVVDPDVMRVPHLEVSTIRDLAPIDMDMEGGTPIGVEGPPEAGDAAAAGGRHAGLPSTSAAGGRHAGLPSTSAPIEGEAPIDEIPEDGAIPIPVDERLVRYVVAVTQSTQPAPGVVMTPLTLNNYPKAGLPAPVDKPYNGVVTSSLFPAV